VQTEPEVQPKVLPEVQPEPELQLEAHPDVQPEPRAGSRPTEAPTINLVKGPPFAKFSKTRMVSK